MNEVKKPFFITLSVSLMFHLGVTTLDQSCKKYCGHFLLVCAVKLLSRKALNYSPFLDTKLLILMFRF